MGAKGKESGRLIALLLVAAAAASGCAALVVGEARINAAPGLAIAVFGTFLTSIAIIIAFSIDGSSRWPTPWEMLGRAHVPIWFLVALASVVTALLSAEIDSPFLSSLGLTLALAAIPLATWSLWRLISVTSERGRWGLVVDLLARSILRAGPVSTARAGPDLGDIDTDDHVPAGFLAIASSSPPRRGGVSIESVPGILREHADRGDLEAIVRLIDEVHAGATKALADSGSVGPGQYLGSVDTVLRVQRGIFEQLAIRVRSGALGEDAARVALARAGEAVIDTSGRACRRDATEDGDLGLLEPLVARHLTALCRTAGAMTHETGIRPERTEHGFEPGAGGAEPARLNGLQMTCRDIQQAVRWAVDPDPPGMKMPPGHPWQTGLSDPESALIWLWSAAESPSGPFGVGLYATCEIVTGRKFFGSYWEGLDIFTEIERRLRFEGDDDSPGLARGRAAIERAGGLPLLALALGSIRLAATPSRSEVDPAGANGASWRDDRHVACNLFLAGGGYKPAGREPVADLAWLLTDRHDGSIWTVVCEQLSQLSDPMLVPPLRPLYRYPEACALAVCLRLAPLERDPAQDRLNGLRDFVAGLPRPLLARTALLGLRLTSTEQPGLPERASDQERALVEAACFVSRIVPGPLPSQPAGPAAAVTPLVPPGLEGPPDFERALSRIAEHGSGPIEVDLIQCDRRWIDRWASLRAALDSALLALALGRGARVRRVVLFDLPSDADRGSTRLHYRWSGSLAAAVGCFEQPDDSDAGASRYQVRQLILPRAGSTVELPGDCIVVRDGAAGGRGDGVEAGEGFEAVWELADRSGRAPERGFGLIELGGNQQRWGSAGEPAGALAEL